ncbi:MAG TPA: hypothetical protein VIQ29_03150 [Ancylobacter sp.]
MLLLIVDRRRLGKRTLSSPRLSQPFEQLRPAVALGTGLPDLLAGALRQLQDRHGAHRDPHRSGEARHLVAKRDLVLLHLLDAVDEAGTLLDRRREIGNRGEDLANDADGRHLGGGGEPATTAGPGPCLGPGPFARSRLFGRTLAQRDVALALVQLGAQTTQFGVAVECRLGIGEQCVEARIGLLKQAGSTERGAQPLRRRTRILLRGRKILLGAPDRLGVETIQGSNRTVPEFSTALSRSACPTVSACPL